MLSPEQCWSEYRARALESVHAQLDADPDFYPPGDVMAWLRAHASDAETVALDARGIVVRFPDEPPAPSAPIPEWMRDHA